MADKEDNGTEYSSLRVLAETNRKLKVLSGLKDKPIIAVLEEMVNKEYIVSLSLAAKGAKLDE
jgi:6-phosphogluconate dehydrogenase